MQEYISPGALPGAPLIVKFPALHYSCAPAAWRLTGRDGAGKKKPQNFDSQRF